MLSAAVAALACLCLAGTSLAEPYNLRLHSQALHNNKDISSILASIEERLRVLDTVSIVQEKQSRRLDVIQDKLDRVETTLALKLERTQLAAERLDHRLYILQTNVQETIKESTEKIERTQHKITELALNLTNHIVAHKTLLEKVFGANSDTRRRSVVLEELIRNGLSLVNATRRELADGLRALARRQRDARLTSSADLEASFARRLQDNTLKIDQKIQEVMETQKRFVDSCQRVQQDDPNHVSKLYELMDKLFETLIKKIGLIMDELYNIRKQDSSVTKFLKNRAQPQTEDSTCHRLERAFLNSSQGIFKENELRQLTEKFVALTNRADAALQRLEILVGEDTDEPMAKSDVSAEADMLMLKLKGVGNEKETKEVFDWDDDKSGYYEDGGGDIMDEDRQILDKGLFRDKRAETTKARPAHRRHHHKHPYDRGPKLTSSLT